MGRPSFSEPDPLVKKAVERGEYNPPPRISGETQAVISLGSESDRSESAQAAALPAGGPD